VPVFVGFDALDVGEIQAFVVQGDVRAVFGVLFRSLTEPLAEDLRSETVRHFALDFVDLAVFHGFTLSPGARETGDPSRVDDRLANFGACRVISC
jgi:hypothetical protein